MPGEGLLRRVKRFARAVERLRRLQRVDRRALLADEDALDVLENNARVAIEALLDVGRFIIASKGWEQPSSYRDVARILERHGVLGRGDAELLRSLAGLGNVIVHMYADLDYEVLAGVLDILDRVEALMGAMLGYIRREGLDP